MKRKLYNLAMAVLAGMLAVVMLNCPDPLRAASAGAVELSLDKAEPRAVEEQTARSIVRDYGAAWEALTRALAADDPRLLGSLWVGFARRQLLDAISQQRQSGVQVYYRDRQHKLEAVFYSPEGSALQLRDTATLEREILDGGKVVASETAVVHYLVVMTPAADGWQVRILQSVPQ